MKNNKPAGQHYRQGDVLLQRVGSLPKNLVKIARENGRVVLAHGEVTGHAHAMEEPGTALLRNAKDEQFVQVKGRKIKATLPVLRQWRDQVMVRHPDFGLVEFAVADVTIACDSVLVDGDFGLLKHDEHNAHAVPAGNYRNVRQSEFDPEEIRSVLD